MARVGGTSPTQFPWHSRNSKRLFLGIDLGTLSVVIRGGRIQLFQLILENGRVLVKRDGQRSNAARLRPASLALIFS